MKEQNVIGTMQLLAACQQAPRLRKLVVRSSTAAYGASFRDPAVFTEDTEPREVPRGGFARDILDIEGYVRGFRRRRPDVTATVLRFAPFIGSTADTTLTRYFAQPVVPTVFGRDPRLQFLHVDDALEVLHRSVVEDHPGTYNVAGPGVLVAVPGDPAGRPGRRAGARAGPVRCRRAGPHLGFGGYGLDQVDLFVHGRVVDTTRLEQEFGFTPRSTAEAFDDFIRAHRGGSWSRASSWPPPSSSSWTASARCAPRAGADAVSATSEPVLRARSREPSGAVTGRGRPTRSGSGVDVPRSRPHRIRAGAAQRTSAGRAGPRRSRRWRTGRGPLGPPGRERSGVPAPTADRRLRGRRVRLRPGADRRASSTRCCGCSTATGSAPRYSASRTCPSTAPALVVGNHSGTVALDALMLSAALHDEHPAHRYLRLLGADLVFRMPVVSEMARKSGGTVACNPDAERLLRGGDLVGVFPEGFKGIGKLYADRYKLQRFGRGGFVSAALRTGTPIVPVAIVGARGDLPDARRHQAAGPAARSCPTSRSRRPSRGSARWAWCRCPASG